MDINWSEDELSSYIETHTYTLVGEGSHGKVMCFIGNTGTLLAVKKYKNAAVAEKEAKAMTMFKHPCVVEHIAQVGIYNIMKYEPGGTLFGYIREHKRIPEHTAKKMFLRIAQSLMVVHNQNCAHMDIKISNIILDENFNPKLCDFGTMTRLRTQSCRIGTEHFMAPEVAARSTYDPKRADIYSLGVCLFVMLFGFFPKYCDVFVDSFAATFGVS
jgi:serine/threonine protein kinase